VSALIPDYYKILEVDRDADDLTLKCAYYKLAAEYHPDHNQDGADAEQKFREIAEAYEVLSDTKRRASYDAGSGVALERPIAVASLDRRESRPPYLRIAPYTIVIATASILWVAVAGLGRLLATKTSHAAVAAPQVTETEAGQKPADRLVAPAPTARVKRAASASGGTVTIVRGATPLTRTQIPYSSDALREHVSGLVELQLTIAADGSVQSPQILSGHPLLAQDVAETVSHWTFQSMRVNGRPVPMTTEMTLRFDIAK
jgi:TonB family protein